MYEFLRGPMMWVSSIICVAGLIYQIIHLKKITGKKERLFFTEIKKKADKNLGEKIKRLFSGFFSNLKAIPLKADRTVIKTQPGITILSFIFHVCLFITPIFLVGHNILLFESWKVQLITLPERVSDILTIVFLICGAVFLFRRIFDAKIRAVSTLWDYILLFITIAPFITGFIAYHQLIDYNTAIISHIISGHVMLIAMGTTKLSHMAFFFFARFFVGSEYSFRAGGRIWN